MNSKAALCAALLAGKIINNKNIQFESGFNNAAREIGRSVEIPFGVKITKVIKRGNSRYGTATTWDDYSLMKPDYNQEGIRKMVAYVVGQIPENPKTEKEVRMAYDLKFIVKAYDNF